MFIFSCYCYYYCYVRLTVYLPHMSSIQSSDSSGFGELEQVPCRETANQLNDLQTVHCCQDVTDKVTGFLKVIPIIVMLLIL